MKKPITFAFFALLVFGLVACNSNSSQDSVSAARDANDMEDTTTFRTVPDLGIDAGETFDDANFAVQAAEASLFEVQLGEIAADRAVNPDVKDFANRMIQDHGNANQELATLAQAKDFILPTAVGRENLEDLGKFNESAANDFDEEYIERMIEDHERTIKLFEHASSQSKDKEVKAFVAKQLAILKQHLEHARKIDEKQ